MYHYAYYAETGMLVRHLDWTADVVLVLPRAIHNLDALREICRTWCAARVYTCPPRLRN